MTSGTRSARAPSAARATFSPTTAPIEPPMNPKSMTRIAIRWPSILPEAPDGGVPEARWRPARRRPGPGTPSGPRTPADPADTRPASRSSNVPSSSSWPRRTGADSRKWCPHDGHTLIAFSSCLLNSCSSHEGQRVHIFSGKASCAGSELGELDGHQAGPPRPAPASAAARRACAVRAARPMSPVPAAAGREARQATKATPTMEIAADVMAAPPTISGRRSTGPAAARSMAASSAGSRSPRRMASRSGSDATRRRPARSAGGRPGTG